jgi:hypothetical protein
MPKSAVLILSLLASTAAVSAADRYQELCRQLWDRLNAVDQADCLFPNDPYRAHEWAQAEIARQLSPPVPLESQLDRHGSYTNSYGQTVHRPAGSLDGSVPAGASAQCRDGTYSFSLHSNGTCSGHGGVMTWLR